MCLTQRCSVELYLSYSFTQFHFLWCFAAAWHVLGIVLFEQLKRKQWQDPYLSLTINEVFYPNA